MAGDDQADVVGADRAADGAAGLRAADRSGERTVGGQPARGGMRSRASHTLTWKLVPPQQQLQRAWSGDALCLAENARAAASAVAEDRGPAGPRPIPPRTPAPPRLRRRRRRSPEPAQAPRRGRHQGLADGALVKAPAQPPGRGRAPCIRRASSPRRPRTGPCSRLGPDSPASSAASSRLGVLDQQSLGVAQGERMYWQNRLGLSPDPALEQPLEVERAEACRGGGVLQARLVGVMADHPVDRPAPSPSRRANRAGAGRRGGRPGSAAPRLARRRRFPARGRGGCAWSWADYALRPDTGPTRFLRRPARPVGGASGWRVGQVRRFAQALQRPSECSGKVQPFRRRQEGADDHRAPMARQRHLAFVLRRVVHGDVEPVRLERQHLAPPARVDPLDHQFAIGQSHLLVAPGRRGSWTAGPTRPGAGSRP